MRILAVVASIAWVATCARAEVRMPAIFGDHMVLQSGVGVNIWGWAAPDEQIHVQLGSQTADARAGAGGKWSVQLQPLKTGENVSLAVRGQANSLNFNDVVAGEVWIASGQSNMALGLNGALGGKEAAADANYPSIRFFTVDKVPSSQPKADCGGRWRPCSPETAGSFSAVGFFFAMKLQHDLGVPVGIINASLNGSTCESWTRKEVLQGDRELKHLVDEWDAKVRAYDPGLETERYSAAMTAYHMKLKTWEQEDADAKAQGTRSPKRPQMPSMIVSPLEMSNYPGNCYNGMLAPLVRFPVKGVIWYQGESNAGTPGVYTRLLSTMISDWRGQWHIANLPFIFVQLPWRGKADQGIADEAWAPMREAQARVLSLPMTAMVVTVDNTEGILHPKDKRPVGERLALAARGLAYGEKLPCMGPVFSHYVARGQVVTLKFTHADGGLVARGGMLTGFSVAGEDRVLVPAKARIVGDRVEVMADGVTSPRSVRYGWMAGQSPSLFNGAGLPAEPFRTDSWRLEGK